MCSLSVPSADPGPAPRGAAAGAGRVFRSVDGTLYLTGGSNEVSSLYTRDGFGKSVDSAGWQAILAARAAAVRQLGSLFVQLLVPEKLTVLPLGESDRQKLFPDIDAGSIVSPGRRLMTATGAGSFLYPDDFLSAQAATMSVYAPTDSHWTWQGAFSAFQLLMSSLHRRPDYAKFIGLPRIKLRYRGDLWESRFADIEGDLFERVTLPPTIRRVYANPLVGLKESFASPNDAGLHMGSHCIFENPAAEFRETVVLFGSSFSDCRLGPSLLTAIFCHYFTNVHFLWSISVDLDYVRRHRPAITIAELPERFLASKPDDAQRVEETSVDKARAWRRQHLRTA